MRHGNVLLLKFEIAKLLQTVKENRDVHVKEFAAAKAAYRAKVRAEYVKRIEMIDAGQRFVLNINIPQPEEHTEDYDRAIRMLELTSDTHIELGNELFGQLVLDEWDWSTSYANNTKSYTSGGP